MNKYTCVMFLKASISTVITSLTLHCSPRTKCSKQVFEPNLITGQTKDERNLLQKYGWASAKVSVHFIIFGACFPLFKKGFKPEGKIQTDSFLWALWDLWAGVFIWRTLSDSEHFWVVTERPYTHYCRTSSWKGNSPQCVHPHIPQACCVLALQWEWWEEFSFSKKYIHYIESKSLHFSLNPFLFTKFYLMVVYKTQILKM